MHKRGLTARGWWGLPGFPRPVFPPFHSPSAPTSLFSSVVSLADLSDGHLARHFQLSPTPLQAARSSSLDRIPSASCKVVRRSRARYAFFYHSEWLTALVLNTLFAHEGTLRFLFRAHPTALSSSGMRASADELPAWEALTVALVVRVYVPPMNPVLTVTTVGMCAVVGSVPVPILARDACITWKIMPLHFSPSTTCGVFEFV
jgi:hypothetical protein